MLLAGVAVAAATFVGVHSATSAHTFVHTDLPILLIPVLCWLFLSERYEITMTLFALYLGCLDGVVKLESGSQLGTLGRDAILYAIVLGAVLRLVLRGNRPKLPPLSGLIGAWVVVVVVQVANPSAISLSHSVQSLRQDLEFVPIFFFAYQLVRTPDRLNKLLTLLVIVGAINGVVSLIQSFLSPAQLASWGPGYAGLELGTAQRVARVFEAGGVAHVRPPGLGGTDGFAGDVCALALPAALALLSSGRGLRRSWWLGPAIAAILLGIITAETRFAIVTGAVGAIAFAAFTLNSRRGLIALALTVVVIAGGFFFGQALLGGSANRLSSKSNARGVATRETALSLIPKYMHKYPLGAGLGDVGPAAGVLGGASGLSGENEFDFLLVETGWPGLLVMAGIWTIILRRSAHLRRIADPDVQRALMALAAGIVAGVAGWFAGPTTSDSPIAPFLWLGLGVVAFWSEGLSRGELRVRPALFTAAR